MTPQEVVYKTVRFQSADRIPYALTPQYGSDFEWTGMNPSPDARPQSGVDEWGCVWENIGVSNLGEVKQPPLTNWAEWPSLNVPDVRDPKRWQALKTAREEAGNKFLLAGGVSLYERVHFLRGLENTWIDIHTAAKELGRLIDVLVDMNLYAIEKYAEAGADGYMWCDDWGLQNRLMISPASWREIWKPRYARVYKAAHEAGLLTFLHSCGDVTSILDDLIAIGLDVIQMDQQENMGLEELGRRFGGRITFWCPVDIQATMAHGTLDEIRAYCRRMVEALGRPTGGFIAKWYGDPKGVGHRPEAIDAMCEEFLKLSARHITSRATDSKYQ
ncbi:MAG: uroporphyrinogen decarboxylase family protein [Candidatus Pacebacteria bacterium]|nr:uroporphyrinogen decarboxylase family protein [Candidatus Paceibacterota bacterium]